MEHAQVDLPINTLNSLKKVSDFDFADAGLLKTSKRIFSDSRIVGKYFQGNYLVRGINSTGYSAVVVLDPSLGGFCQIRTNGDYGNATITSTSLGDYGQELYLKIDNDTDGNKVMTFGSQFKVTGTLTGSTAASAILHFISDSTAFWEVSRTTGLNQ